MTDGELQPAPAFLWSASHGIALMGLGFIATKVALIVQPTEKAAWNQWLSRGRHRDRPVQWHAGGELVQHRTVLSLLSTDEMRPRPRWPLEYHDHSRRRLRRYCP